MDNNSLKPYLLPKEGGAQVYLNTTKFTLGRSLNNSFTIEDLLVSRTHCLFENVNGLWCLSDQSSNGTFLNQKKLPSKTPHVLSDGDTIKLTERIEYIFVNKKKDSLDDVDLSGVFDDAYLLTTESEVEVFTSELNNEGNILVNTEHFVTINNPDAQNTNAIDDMIVPSVNEHTYCTNVEANNVDMSTTENPSSNKIDEASTCNVATNSNKCDEIPQCSKDLMEQYEEELQCIICTELFVKATTLNCSHSFCKFCIQEWNKKNKKCPVCRAKIRTITPTIVLDNFIGKIVESASQDVKDRRAEVIKEREKVVPPIIIKAGKVLRSRDIAPIEISSDEDDDSYDEEDDYFEGDEYGDDDDSNYNGVSGAYYGGYGHCYSCGDRGHWSNGCPYR